MADKWPRDLNFLVQYLLATRDTTARKRRKRAKSLQSLHIRLWSFFYTIIDYYLGLTVDSLLFEAINYIIYNSISRFLYLCRASTLTKARKDSFVCTFVCLFVVPVGVFTKYKIPVGVFTI